MAGRYPVAEPFSQVCTLLDLSPERVLRRAGLPADWFQMSNSSVDIHQFYRLWEAVSDEAPEPGFELFLAKTFAHGPFSPPIFAFSCAETIYLGLKRLALFKPLLGPCKLNFDRGATHTAVRLASVDPGIPIPDRMELFETIFILECARTFSGVELVPEAVELVNPYAGNNETTLFFGTRPRQSGLTRIVLRNEDADLPLITRSQALWSSVEPLLNQQLETNHETVEFLSRVRQVLEECLPAGVANVSDVARRLNLSKRTFQRKLQEHGTSFQAVLSQTRERLAETYLRDTALSVPEISHLLGFRDTGSFFRAFQSWTGATPGSYRRSSQR